MIRLRYIIGSVVALATVVLVAFAAVLYPVYVNLESCGPNVDSVHLDYRAPPVPTGISDYGIIDHNGSARHIQSRHHRSSAGRQSERLLQITRTKASFNSWHYSS